MKVLGIDPGSRTGWGVVESVNGKRRVLGSGVIKVPRRSLAEGEMVVRARLLEFAREFEVDLVAIEDYADWSASQRARAHWHGRWKKFDGKDPTRRGNWRATYVSVRLVQAVSELERHYKVIYCYPQEWQIGVCGVTGGKAASRWTVKQIFDLEPKADHECDAILIALYAIDREIMGRKVG